MDPQSCWTARNMALCIIFLLLGPQTFARECARPDLLEGAGRGLRPPVPPPGGADWSVGDGHGAESAPSLRQSRALRKGLEAGPADVCGCCFVRTRARPGGLWGLVWDRTEKPSRKPRPATFLKDWRPPAKGGSRSWPRAGGGRGESEESGERGPPRLALPAPPPRLRAPDRGVERGFPAGPNLLVGDQGRVALCRNKMYPPLSHAF